MDKFFDLSNNLSYNTCIVSGAYVGSELDHPIEQRAAIILHCVH